MCGVCGIYLLGDNHLPDIARAVSTLGIDGQMLVDAGAGAAGAAFFLLHHSNHRGSHSSGIAASDGTRIMLVKGMGFARQVFNQQNLESLV